MRKRDTLRTRSRYSPPPVVVKKHSLKLPLSGDTSSSRKSTRNQSNGLQAEEIKEGEGTSRPVDVTIENEKFLVKLPDGSTVDIPIPVRPKEEPDSDDERQQKVDEKDEDYVPEESEIRLSPGVSKSKPLKMSNSVVVKLTNHPISTRNTGSVALSNSSEIANKPAILLTSNSQKQPATVAKIVKNILDRPFPLGRYSSSLPPIEDCINPDFIDDSAMRKIPDRILLVTTELPIRFATSVEKEGHDFVFRQVVSPVETLKYVCLLCKGIDVDFGTKDQKDIIVHYRSLHELDVEVTAAKFNDTTVFICLPKAILKEMSKQNAVALHYDCQYCTVNLKNITDMKEHYLKEHDKQVS